MTDISMPAGNARVLEVTVLDGDGALVSLLGATSIKWQVASSVDGPAIISKSIGSGVTLIDAQNGRFDVELAEADTAALQGVYYYEAQVVDEEGEPSTVMSGGFTVTPVLIPAEPLADLATGFVAPTPAHMRAFFPTFAAVNDAVIQRALTRALSQVDDTWVEADYAEAVMLYAGHLMTMDGVGSSTEVKLMGFSSIKVGPLELQRSGQGRASSGAKGQSIEPGSLSATSFGVRFQALAAVNFAGPLVV